MSSLLGISFDMNQNQFEMIIRRMEQRYSRIHKGDEEVHAMMIDASDEPKTGDKYWVHTLKTVFEEMEALG